MKSLSLKNRLFITFTLLLIMISTIIFAVTYNLFREIIVDQIGQSRVDVLKQIGERTSIIQNSLSYVSNLYFFDSSIQLSLEQEQFSESENAKFAKSVQDSDIKYKTAFNNVDFEYEIEIYGKNGLSYQTAALSKKNFESIQNSLWYRDVLKADGSICWVSSLEQTEQYDKYILRAARIIKDNAGNIIGILLINADERYLLNTYINIMTMQNDIYIINDQGTIVSNTNGSMLGLNYFNMKRLNDLLGDKSFSIINNNGIEKLISIHVDSISGWTILEFINTEQIFGGLYRTTYMIIGIVMIAIIISIGLAYYFALSTTIPLKKFSNYMERVENGDMEVISSVTGWKEISNINNGFNRMVGKVRELLVSIKAKERERHELEIDFLQAQINPHFLYNTLFSIKCLVSMNKMQHAENMLTDFISLLRLTLGGEEKTVTLGKELECLEKYINIQRYRYTGKIDFYIDCEESHKIMKIPKLILQPLIENSIFHGIAHKESNGLIVVQSSVQENILVIEVSDDGVGMSDKVIESIMNGGQINSHKAFKSIGLANVNRRLVMNYGEEYGLKIVSEIGCGTNIQLSFPISI